MPYIAGGTQTPIRLSQCPYGIEVREVNTSVRVSFPSPSATLQTGAGLQEFRVLVRKYGTGALNPLARIELYETGGTTPLATVLANTAVSSNSGVVLSATWDASLLGAVSGANVEVRVVGTGVSGGVLEVGAIEWIPVVVAAAPPPDVYYMPPSYMVDFY